MSGLKVLSGSDAGTIELGVDDNLFSANVNGELALQLNNLWSSLQGVPTFISDIVIALNNYGYYGIAGTGVEYWPTDDPAILGDRVILYEGRKLKRLYIQT
jgi:hypothetical protein